MGEDIPTNENGAEKFPNEREVLKIFEDIIDGDFEILRSLGDEQGLYMLEVQTTDEAGDIVQYNYIRAGKYPEGSSSETVIDVIFFAGDVPVGGHPIMKFKNGEWVKEGEKTPDVDAAFIEKIKLLVEEAGYEVVGDDGGELYLRKVLSGLSYIVSLKYSKESRTPAYEEGIEIKIFRGAGTVWIDDEGDEGSVVEEPVSKTDIEDESGVIYKEINNLLNSLKKD